jgi:hypothetical protein
MIQLLGCSINDIWMAGSFDFSSGRAARKLDDERPPCFYLECSPLNGKSRRTCFPFELRTAAKLRKSG